MDAYKDVFLAESADYIQQITDGLLALEREPHDLAPIETVFRGAHSLKGMSAAMGYLRAADLTHAMEELMSRVRAGELAVDASLVDVMLHAVDVVRDLIDDEAAGTATVDPLEVISLLGLKTEAARQGDADHPATSQRPTLVLAEGERMLSVAVTLEEGVVLKGARAYMVLKRLNQLGRVIDTVPSAAYLEDERFDLTFSALFATSATDAVVSEALLGIAEVATVDIAESEHAPSSMVEGGATGAESKARFLSRQADTHTVRVAIGALDTLVDLVGEVVILRSRFERLVQDRDEDLALAEVVGDMNRITGELQYRVLRTRMVPVGNVFRRFPRMVRDLAVDLGKQVDFEISGLDIELDRTLLDDIGDSIVHLLRNAIDHGIEPAEERVAAGKPAAGSLRLSAARERDHVAISVADDGRGIDPSRVWEVACERGLANPQDRAEYGDADIVMFTCTPGFSTAETATQVSGRGVGLDVVKGHVDGVGGTMQISNRLGGGTEFRLLLPLTLAIVKALLVESRGESFAVPISAVNEVLAVKDLRIEAIDGAPVLVGEDDVVPLVRLDSILYGGDPTVLPDAESNVVLIASAGERRALVVDRVIGRQEVVVKPLGSALADMPGYSGATILGDGRVMLILDPRTLFSHMEVTR